MADYVEKWGDDVESAIELALKDLKLSRDEVTYTVLEEPSKGFLGLFNKKLAKVRVEKKKAEAPVKEVKAVEKPVSEKPAKSFEKAAAAPEKTEKTERFERRNDQPKYGDRPEKRNNRNSRKPEKRFDAERPAADEDKAPKTSSLMNTKFTVAEGDAVTAASGDEPAIAFVHKIAQDMELSINADGSILDGVLYVNLSGKDVGPLIGKRGQTLDAIQYLASIVENKNREDHLRVVINAESYREKREKTLQNLARRLADKCVRNGRNVKLEPMNPYERKVIHSTLQSNPRVTTRSEGVEPNRRVIIEYVRGGRR
ncbi:MAG: Jag N-terminal domain-containing protein [Clostridia bacterium]|nr:Jag N-terminal domain-containing protein [Clostridia bacterium]